MKNSYHNTTASEGTLLIQFELSAKAQDDYILDWFKVYPSQDFTPEEIYDNLFKGTNVPLTSCRRSITNLTKKRLLKKTLTKRKGHYGVLCGTWIINLDNN